MVTRQLCKLVEARKATPDVESEGDVVVVSRLDCDTCGEVSLSGLALAVLGSLHWKHGARSRYESERTCCASRLVLSSCEDLPDSAGRRQLAYFSSASPLMYWHAGPCASSVTVSETAHSPWIPDQVASGVLPGSSPVCLQLRWLGPFFVWLSCVQPEASPLHFFQNIFSPQLGPVD